MDAEAIRLCSRRGQFWWRPRPSAVRITPGGASDLEIDLGVMSQQALRCRLCGDRNPSHSDPESALTAGFPKPIPHGSCTYGMICKALVDTSLDGDTLLSAPMALSSAGSCYRARP